MGEFKIDRGVEAEKLRLFVRRLLDDVRALERMLANGLIESNVQRIGSEQEMFLIDAKTLRPANLALKALEAIDEPHFTTELGLFNLECNLDPQRVGPGALLAMEHQLLGLLERARTAVASLGGEVFLTGILPTLEKSDLDPANMTPLARYGLLADTLRRLRGEDFFFYIKGRDELVLRHRNIMLEAANTSFQFHLQAGPDNFARLYNIAQVVAAPVLAIGCNSPLLFGRRLWAETRIAVFKQSVDTRRSQVDHRSQRPRVQFGERYLDDSVVEIFQEDISSFRVLITTELGDDPLAALDRGIVPDLKALRLHNGTVYRWNRPCYGVVDNVPHLRIEARMLPAGPTVIDEMANAAFWLGLVHALDREIGDVRGRLRFDAAHENFLAAARLGLRAPIQWLDGSVRIAGDLIRDELLPQARRGLVDLGVSGEEIERYLTVVAGRAETRRTGAQWQLDSLARLGGRAKKAEIMGTLVATALHLQKIESPVHEWPLAELHRDESPWQHHYARVADLMSTELYTVADEEVLDLVASLMDWRHVHHIPVENENHELVGLVSHRSLLRFLAQRQDGRAVPVREVMTPDPIRVAPETSSLEAIRIMKENNVAALPVVDAGGHLVGIVTEHDFLRVADSLLEDFFGPESRLAKVAR